MCEDYGWREWIWFPGLSQDAFAHWWVAEATTALRGEFYPVFGPLARVAQAAIADGEQLTLNIDGTHNTYLSLSKKYKATLPPKFAWSKADPNDCGFGPVMEDLLKWWKAIELTRTSPPESYLWAFKTVCSDMEYFPGFHRIPPEVLALVEFEGETYLRRNWDGLPGLLPIPLFSPETTFWEVDGEPFWGRLMSYRSAKDGRLRSETFMRDQGRTVSEEEFLFLVSFLPGHQVPGLPSYTSRTGALPDQLPPTTTYWQYEGGLAALAPAGFVRCWPDRGLVNAEEVRQRGIRISEDEFRRHFPAYSRG